jgi:protein-S-isoprenylcysteine O-methyltransferase Ste14
MVGGEGRRDTSRARQAAKMSQPWAGPLARTIVFTILIPTTVTVAVPYYLLPGGDFELGRGRLAGIPLIALGVAFYLRCAWDFARVGLGTPAPIDPPRHLVATGLYRYVRNPMYVGVLSVLFGEVLFFESRGVLVFALFFALAVHLFVILYEEPTLRRKFGASYHEYCRRVLRWIPNLKP